MLTKYTDVALRDKGVTAVAIQPGEQSFSANQHMSACFPCVSTSTV
jgi:hypothetical protein